MNNPNICYAGVQQSKASRMRKRHSLSVTKCKNWLLESYSCIEILKYEVIDEISVLAAEDSGNFQDIYWPETAAW